MTEADNSREASKRPQIKDIANEISKVLLETIIDSRNGLVIGSTLSHYIIKENIRAVVNCANLGETQLIRAVRMANYIGVKTLLELEADVQLSGKQTTTPLHQAIQSRVGDDIVKLLLDYKADPNAIDSKTESPLHLACALGSQPHVELLVQAGGFPDKKCF